MLMRSPTDHLLPSLESCLVLVREGLVKVAGGENPEADLRHLRAVLLNLLDLIEGDSRRPEPSTRFSRLPWRTRESSPTPQRRTLIPRITSCFGMPTEWSGRSPNCGSRCSTPSPAPEVCGKQDLDENDP